MLTGTLTDLARTRTELVAENAPLRQQLINLRRQVMRPPSIRSDRLLLGMMPRFLIRDNDSKFGSLFACVASSSRVKVLKTPHHAPLANACCERFLGSVRRECLDHLLILYEQQLARVLHAYVTYFNQARSHQGLQQQIPDPPASALRDDARDGPIPVLLILGGLHHEYRRVA